MQLRPSRVVSSHEATLRVPRDRIELVHKVICGMKSQQQDSKKDWDDVVVATKEVSMEISNDI